MTHAITADRDGDSHLRPVAYYALAGLAGLIGLSASAVTIQLFGEAIRVTEPEGHARELLVLTAALFVVAELAACFIAGLVPVRRLRALRWQLTACALALVAFEAVSLYGARVVLIRAAEAQAGATQGRAEALRAGIEASRRNAAALLAAGEVSSRSVLASSRAEGARSIRDAAAMETQTARLAAELAQVEAARVPTAATVFGQSGVVAMAVAQSLLISCIGLLFLGAAGALARAARDARAALALIAPTVTAAPTSTATTPAAEPAALRTSYANGIEATPEGQLPTVPHLRRWAAASVPIATIPAAFAAPPVTISVPAATATEQAATVPTVATDSATDPIATVAATPETVTMPTATVAAAKNVTPEVATIDAETLERPATVRAPTARAATADQVATVMMPTVADDTPKKIATVRTVATRAPRTPTVAIASAASTVSDRYARIRAGILSGTIRPSVRAVMAAEGGGSYEVSALLRQLEAEGVLHRNARGYTLAVSQ